MKKSPVILICLVAAVSVLVFSCGTTKVTRVSSDTQIDLSGRWNDTDAQMVAEAMIEDVLKRPWLDNFSMENGRRPVVIVGSVANRTSEHIEMLVFVKSLERELVNSGKVRFVASADERSGVRDERLDQQTEASEATMKRLGQELGADFYLGGVMTSIEDAENGKRVAFYKVNLELINIETNEKVWIGDKEIKKYIEIPRNRL